MKKYTNFYILLPIVMLFAGCSGGPVVMLYDTEAPGKVVPAENNGKASVTMDMSPDSLGKTEVPGADKIAVHSEMPLYIANQIAKTGVTEEEKAASLDANSYNIPAPALFSALLDAMTALNLPIEHIDSPSGTVITGWIRTDAAQVNIPAQKKVRYRYVARVFRAGDGARLELQTMGQMFLSDIWTNRAMPRKVSNELFYTVKEHLGIVE